MRANPVDELSQALSGAWVGIGNGVTVVDTGNPLGLNVFIGYAGYNINLAQAQAWTSALYDAKLRELGVRYVYAIQGPADSAYNGLEIGNSKLIAHLGQVVTGATGFIAVAGHSSGAFVADELLKQLDTGADPFGVYGSRMTYFCLDGDQKYVGPSGINRLKRAYYVSAYNPTNGVVSWNSGAMKSLGASFAGKGGWFEYDASGSGCTAGGCVHISLINTHPHSASSGSGLDYADFGGRPVNAFWLDAKRGEAGFGQCDTSFITEGLIQDEYAALGGCASFLGAPTTPMLPTPDGKGRYNHFKNSGSIYWSFFTGAHEVHGVIRDRWIATGWEQGPLGYPTANEQPTPGGNGRFSRFEHGAIYWSQATGAHGVWGPAYTAWAARGLSDGPLGFPTADEVGPVGARVTRFVHGTITVKGDGSTEVTLDSAPQNDGGNAPDAGLALDAGTINDGGHPPPSDAGPESPALMPEPVTGGCSAAGGNAAWLALAFGAQRIVRRKRGTNSPRTTTVI